MFSAFSNCFKLYNLRQRIFFTLAILFVIRFGSAIPLPGIDTTGLKLFLSTKSSSLGASLLSMYNMFTGGALLKGAIFALGVMPYISASIIFQLLTPVVPFLARLQLEGDSGRQKLTQYTRYLTIGVCLLQSLLLIFALAKNPGSLLPGYDVHFFGSIVLNYSNWFILSSVIFLTAGTMILMWLGDFITQKGLGNGVSLIIAVGILADLPQAVFQAYHMVNKPIGLNESNFTYFHIGLMVMLLVAVVAAIVAVTQSVRKIPVQYARRLVGRKIYGGQSSFLPLKLNYSGVMPVIFATAILTFPQQICAYLAAGTGWRFFQDVALYLTPGAYLYYLLYGFLIFAFSYFWVSIMFKPVQIADDLKKNGGYIPGVRPGVYTAHFLDFVMTRLTFSGSLFLLLIALLPNFLNHVYHVPYNIALFFGGTGTLISVGVVLETMRQIESFLVQRKYEGFFKISQHLPSLLNMDDAVEIPNVRSLLYFFLTLSIIGFCIWGVNISY